MGNHLVVGIAGNGWESRRVSGLPDDFGCQQTPIVLLEVRPGLSELLYGPRIAGRRQFLEPGVDVLGKQAH